ncbi:hypothetical protein IFO69_09390 [Echinicola sp. CAU 1574]|uniref:Uncharacterized protein n=1 Tax=Echinicola arenosa TaxID=2774144 RepID=A0ABR9AKS5_9BACT|nr:hypothetical protein [Echinicola arenosa]MBD8488957.1 hypothetical protein [Echinicola arenosa]
MKHSLPIKVSIFFLALVFCSFSLFAQEEAPSEFIRVIVEFKVKEGQTSLFEKSISSWKECYLSNGGETAWSLFRRMDGEGDNYVLTYVKPNWAAFDDKDKAAGSCNSLADLMLSPNVEESSRYFTKFMPEISKQATPESPQLVAVTFFKVKTGKYRSFMDHVKTISGHIASAEGSPRGYWYRYLGGGENAPEFFTSNTHQSFSDLDGISSIWNTVENVLGKKEKDKLYDTFFESVDDLYNHIYQLIPEISNLP